MALEELLKRRRAEAQQARELARERLRVGDILVASEDRTEEAYLRIAEACERMADAMEHQASLMEQVFAGTVTDDIKESDEPEPVTSWNSGKR